MTRFKQAIRIGSNVTDIMKLPCVLACVKRNFVHKEWLEYSVMDDYRVTIAEEGDWLCQRENGQWHVMDDEHYREVIGEQNDTDSSGE